MKRQNTGNRSEYRRRPEGGIHGTGTRRDDPRSAAADRKSGEIAYPARALSFRGLPAAEGARETHDPRAQGQRQKGA